MSDLSNPEPGLIVLFGSGETSPRGRKIFDGILRLLPQSPRIALLETPAGFELNSHQVINRVGNFFIHRLQNYSPQVEVIPARKRGTPLSPDEPDIVAPLLKADMIFMGPGSPSYAVRQLSDSLAWHYLVARHRCGTALALASAATIAFSAYALPVYEIYKVGEDLHWIEGLDFFGLYGLKLVLIPHWNNHEGGTDLDTSRCFMGQERFAQLMEMLPGEMTVVGLDEKTALIICPSSGECHVSGQGKITLLHKGHKHILDNNLYPQANLSMNITGSVEDIVELTERNAGHFHEYRDGQIFPISDLGPFRPFQPESCFPPSIWETASHAFSPPELEESTFPPDEVMSLVQAREQARMSNLWTTADSLRKQIGDMGWEVSDTNSGPILRKLQSINKNN